MKVIKNTYAYLFADFWNNQWNMMLIQYYTYLMCWFPLAFNS